MTTFSQLVDSVVAECRRPDMLREVITYTNQTIREVHFDPKNEAAVLLKENFAELMLIPTVEHGFSWQVPDMGAFQAMQVVKYLIRNQYVPERIPSRALRYEHEYYYRTGGQFIFSGYCGVNDQIAIGFYEYPRRLVYYPAGSRPAEYQPDLGWTYAGPFQGTEELNITAQILVSNWILLRWTDTILEGVRAKVYKRVSDTDRARTCYSMYTSMRAQLISSESVSVGGYT